MWLEILVVTVDFLIEFIEHLPFINIYLLFILYCCGLLDIYCLSNNKMLLCLRCHSNCSTWTLKAFIGWPLLLSSIISSFSHSFSYFTFLFLTSQYLLASKIFLLDDSKETVSWKQTGLMHKPAHRVSGNMHRACTSTRHMSPGLRQGSGYELPRLIKKLTATDTHFQRKD